MTPRASLVALVTAGCNGLIGNGGFHTRGDGGAGGDAAASGDAAAADASDACTAQGKPTTSLSGRAYAPNGTLPLYNAAVYVPTAPLAAIPDGVGGPTCASGSPAVLARTDAT